MSVFYVHLCWMIVFMFSTLFFLCMSLLVSFFSNSIFLKINIFSSWFMSMSLDISFDIFSSWFSLVVCFISSIIMIYSYFYMAPYSKHNYFIWLTVFFVLSMLIVINFCNIFFVMLGWDGLGLVSFFLIVYYQNFSSISSGLFTVLMNRVGDCFFIVSISLFFLAYSNNWSMNDIPSFMFLTFLLLTFMTKSAIFPFSPWLPLAMAAPAPISALVHSSTLVTAGLYLMMRFSFLFYSNYTLMYFLLVLSVFTSFYAGLNSIFEMDMKKLIALSTLSHLGFIGMAYSCGLIFLAFFHLLVHALFKSALFMSMGDIMTNMHHSQDIRFLSSGLFMTPSSCYTMYVSLINLLGLPSISGYYSKDLVLETSNFSNSSFIMVFMIFMNVFFTYYYSYKLFYFSFSTLKLTPYILVNSSSLTHSILLLSISALGVFFGFIWVNYINFYIIHVMVPMVWKLTPYILNLLVLSFLLANLSLFSFKSQILSFYFSNMMFLSCVMMTFMSKSYVTISFELNKVVEYGALNTFLNKNVGLALANISLNLFKFSSISSMISIVLALSSILMLMLF